MRFDPPCTLALVFPHAGVDMSHTKSPTRRRIPRIDSELRPRLLEGIIASAMDAIITVDSNQRIVLFNPAAERMFLISATEAAGQTLDRFIPERFRASHQRTIGQFDKEVRNMGRAGVLQVVKGLRANGAEFPAETSISQMESGGVKYYTAVVRDISQRTRVEEALRETGQRLLLAVETAQLGTYERDLRSDEVHVNDACRQLLGVRPGALPPDIAQRSAHPEDRERVLAAVSRAFDPQLREVCASEFRIVRPDGIIRWVAGRGRVVFDETVTPAQPQKFLGVLLDITAAKLAEAKLVSAQRELTRTNAELEARVSERTARLHEMIGELEHMAYGMIHDMRAPLRAIQSFAEILEQDPASKLSEEAGQLIRKMRTASYRMDQLLTGALSYKEAVQKPLPVGPANVFRLLSDLLAAYPEFKPPHAEVTLEGSFPWVTGNEAGLFQCFAELIRNGVKFVGPGKPARIRVWTKEIHHAARPGGGRFSSRETPGLTSPASGEDWVRLNFEDNGTGIPESGRGRIFDLFQRLHGPEYPGAGVGLALVRKLVEHMGGHVGFESKEGKGSRFWLELPRPSLNHKLQLAA